MRPKPLQLTATTDEKTEKVGPALRALMIKNVGSNNVYIDFDNAIVTTESYLLEAGETITMEYDFINLYYKTASGTSTLHCIKIVQ
jgi:enhancing lycopene biosynthesis protein 2